MAEPSKESRFGFIPRPPPMNTAADFVVVVFVVLIATMLLIFTVGIVIAGILGEDVASLFNVITDIMTTIIGALVGFLAGKGQGRAEMEQDLRNERRDNPP